MTVACTKLLTFHNLNGHGILDIIIFVVSSSCRHWLDMHTLPYLNAYSSGKFKWTVQNAIYGTYMCIVCDRQMWIFCLFLSYCQYWTSIKKENASVEQWEFVAKYQ